MLASAFIRYIWGCNDHVADQGIALLCLFALTHPRNFSIFIGRLYFFVDLIGYTVSKCAT